MMNLSITTKLELNNDEKIPIFGLGTWKSEEGKECENAVYWALKHGYIHIDTAAIYGNERSVGKGLHKFLSETGTSRDDIYITTKLWISDFEYDKVFNALETSLKKLKLHYVDLYLLHWPESKHRIEAWKALEKINKKGTVKSIGVSNFLIPQLEELLAEADVIPQINQVEFTPFLYLKDLHNYCEKKGIKIEAYSPLTHGKRLDNQNLRNIAANYNKSTAQILIRWGLQKKIVEIPKSVNKQHIIENAQIFDFNISEEDMKKLDGLDMEYRAMEDPEWHPTHERWK
ncbi:MAG: aldo/keto reductase [Candidatus Lokiarchaeota archaeon]|nr:aldo/keto reductase [Candidatus Lokiarchaeota archaeon]